MEGAAGGGSQSEGGCGNQLGVYVYDYVYGIEWLG